MVEKEKDPYEKLIEHLREFVIPPPKSDTLRQILEHRHTPEEAELMSILPFAPSTARKISRKLGIPKEELIEKMEGLIRKGHMYKDGEGKGAGYHLAESVWQFLRMPWWIAEDNEYYRKLAKLMNKYYIEEFGPPFMNRPTIPMRVIPIDQTVVNSKEVIPHEHMMNYVDNWRRFSVSACSCRLRHNLDPAFEKSEYPMRTCMHMDDLADFAIKYDMGEEITKEEAIEILNGAADAGLVHCVENHMTDNTTICNCDPDYCIYFEKIKNLPKTMPVGTTKSNYIREIDEEKCIGCGLCAKRCPMDAIEFVEEEKRVIFTPGRCIGCGVCVHKCPADAIWLKKRDIEHTYPVDGMEIGQIMTKELGGDFEEIRKRLQSF